MCPPSIHSFVLHTPRLGIIAASQRMQAVAPERRRGMAMRRRHRQIHRQARVEGAPARGGACEGRIILYNSRGNSIDGTLHITRLRGPFVAWERVSPLANVFGETTSTLSLANDGARRR